MAFKHQDLTSHEVSQIIELLEQQIKVCGSEIKKQYETILFKFDYNDLTEPYKAEPEQQEEDFFKAILETAKENGHQEPTQAETEQAQRNADLNLSKYCEGLK